MGHCSLRSLLVAAILISNCITWTASRHHYTHNVHGHRSRHRRQGAGLFLSSSYVIPGGEGAGAWGEWGEVSPCSRTCGGGVASQKRICLEVGPDGQPRCSGGDTKYFSCETQDCPDGSRDFRAEQCSEYDNVAFKGIKYTWVPYTKGPNPCELNCMPRGERFYYRQQSKVVDGTRCNEESFDVCVNGICQPVGCDFMLGSSAREDKCRECRGNGANCHTVSDLLDTQDLRNGYNDVLLIPQGATSINIEEIKPSSNYLAIRAKNNTYYLNGDYHIDFPRSIEIAGATWHYERSQNGLPSPDKLRCLGPTNEPLFLSLLLQEPNVGIQYEYSVPQALAPPPNQQYNWVHGEFTPCSATCGGGFQTRDVTCRSREELDLVDEGLCNDAFRPAANQSCATNPCAAKWVEGPWGPCSKHCGEGGSRSRQVHCEKIITNGYPSVVADKECFELLGPKPALFEQCNQNATCPQWFTGPWKPCDKLCDEGKQKRQVVCYQKSEGKIEVLDDEQCVDEKPAVEQPCILHPCEGVDWMLTDWVGCDSCLSTVRTRSAVCATRSYIVVNDSLCEYHPVPVLEEQCDKAKLPACEVQWYATQWSKCSAECGKGVQTRRVFCGLFDGASVVKVDDARCDQETKYNDSKPCEIAKCPSKWYAGPWSECSAICGGGEQYRRVTCLSGGETAKCDPDTVLDSTQSCNVGPCNEDQLITLSPSSAPITDGDEDELCEGEEDYPEVGAEEDSSLTTLTDMMFSDSPSSSSDFAELESVFTSGSGYGTTDGSGESTESTEFTETTEEGSGTEITSSTDTDETSETGSIETGSTDLSSSLATEPTAIKDTASTELGSPKSSGSTESESTEETDTTGSTESTESSSTIVVDYDYTDKSTTAGPTGSTESSESSGATDSTVSGASEASTESTSSGSTETASSDEIGSTGTDETSESSAADETSESSTDASTSSSSTESESTDETTASGSTESDSTDTTESPGSTEVESTGSTELSGSTEAGTTESSGSTESGSTEVSGLAETTVSGATEISGSTEATSEGGSTESGDTEASGSTDLSGSTEVSGSTEFTEAGSTEAPGSTESESTDVSGSTETSITESESTGSTSETETGETGSTEASTTKGSTESATEETGSTMSGSEETGSTETGSSEGTTEGLSSVSGEESSLSTDSTPALDWASTLELVTKKSKCKVRSSRCAKTKFGCCPDKRTAAAGPFDEGCLSPKTCTETAFGCCPDGVSPARGAKNKGCPLEACQETLFGCCKSDNKTPAEGNDQEGCPPPPPPCKASQYGCCKDEKTQATGPKKKGCPETEEAKKPETKPGAAEKTPTPLPEGVECKATEFGCCPDGVSPAAGSQMEGCVMSCNSSAYGCCPDGETPAHGYDNEGCCLLYPFGCCPDNFKPAEGPHLEGCGCQFSRFGCCPDNATLASGPDNEGCGCQYTEHGCCPDRHTPATGPDSGGCDCHTHQFGCCEDGVTIATGPGQQGCLCQHSEFGCCGDDKTPAVGPDQAGCDCSTSKYGCCPDGQTPAEGSKFLGCTDKPVIRQAACQLSTDRGPCTNYSVYWYYDLQYGGCSRFWYGGCEGNGNRFTSKEECEDVCVNPSPQDACNLPMVKGACTGYHPRWFYDAAREHCGQFVFGGCLGNANNFDTRELCQKQCEPAKSEDQCSQAIDGGSCHGNFLRWGWNPDAERCEQFVWGGCEGTANRFSSEAACLHRCNPPGVPKPQCKEPREAGNCTEKRALWAFSQTEDRCLPFYYTGCGGNNNRFDSQRSCADACPSSYVKDMCTLPAVTGECADYTEKWYYDTTIKRCRQFYYGGCGGNENRFSTQLECENQCSELRTTTPAPTTPPVTAPTDVCTLPSMTGDCDNYREKWFFDSSINRCRQFYYGGCGGNGNRFETDSECEARCVPARTTATTTRPRPQTQAPDHQAGIETVCFMGPDPGPCSDAQPRWAYDASRGVCVQFTYGGCGGNQNNFPDQDYCQQACGATQDVCQLPMLSGPCDESLMRWFYDASSDSCSQFAYGGCEGNDNRFESLEECEQRCRSGPAPAPSPYNNTTPAPGDDLPPACRALLEANEECDREGEVWYLDLNARACVPHVNSATGRACRRSGVHRSEEACERACGAFRELEVCRYPVDPGPCRSAVPKFYYDEVRGVCQEFTYGGCHGGPNRFSTIEECVEVCKLGNESPTTSTTTPAPWEAPEPQPVDEQCVTPTSFESWACDSSTPRYIYDAELHECVLSPHGDCGHRNSYASEEDCERTCGAFRGLDPCRSPLDVGMCNSAIPKFYWKLSSGRCEPFSYSGCGGGPNRFSSVAECQRVCSGTGPEAVCLEPVDSGEECGEGKGEGPSRRWYYSEPAAQCLPFVFRGCGGSANNFRSPGACAAACHTTIDQGNEVLPDCDQYNEECGQIRCEYGVQRTRTSEGCERCTCVPVDVDCTPLMQECQDLKCAYGLLRTVGADGCERCTCTEHPCANKDCPSGERCVATPYRNPITQDVEYTADCRVVNKPGSCPLEMAAADEGHCRRECNDDADCRGVGKCCARGCSQLCLEPATPTSPQPVTTTYAPELPQAPQANPVTEPEVKAAEGGKATLRCLFHGNPPPKITWRRGEITIDGDVGRYRLLSDGALEIVSLYRNDSGVYICVAENVHGVSQQEVHLQVNVAVNTRIPYEATTQVVGAELSLPCDVDGYPLPVVYWTKDNQRLAPDARTQITDARLTISGLTLEDSGVYGCHARNDYSAHSSTIQITVQGVLIPRNCTDNPFFADCKLIVRSKFCNHQYYSRFCCESCVKAGQLNALELSAQSDAAWTKRK